MIFFFLQGTTQSAQQVANMTFQRGPRGPLTFRGHGRFPAECRRTHTEDVLKPTGWPPKDERGRHPCSGKIFKADVRFPLGSGPDREPRSIHRLHRGTMERKQDPFLRVLTGKS